jgi:hypothetical protein
MRRGPTPAEKFWIGGVIYVLVADVYLWRCRKDTMSIQFDHWLQTPRGRRACAVAWGGLSAHLFMGMPLPFQAPLRKYLGGKND